MIRTGYRLAALAAWGVLVASGCAHTPAETDVRIAEPELIAQSDRQWTGVAATRNAARVFVNYPRWGGPYRYAVEELLPSGERRAYPDAVINTWSRGLPASERFVCVQSVTVDDRGDLWVLDPANPRFQGVVAGGPKLVRIDLRTNEVARIILLDDRLALADSYLNDVRLDRDRGFAYLTDSGNSALVVLNLNTGKGRRILDGHHSTTAEPGFVPEIDGREWRTNDGEARRVHADGIALSRDGKHLYWQSLTARDLYRIDTSLLRDFSRPMEDIADGVEHMGRTVVTDGMEIDAHDRVYFSALEENAIIRREPDGSLLTVSESEDLDWPDSFAWLNDRELLVTTAQINEGEAFMGADGPDEPYGLWKITLPFRWLDE